MRIGKKQFISGLAVLTLTMPVWARTYKQSLPLQKDATIGSAQLKPGEYQLTADDAKTELNILRNGKVVATVPGQWVKIQKPQSSTVLSDGDKITQVQFGGSEQAFQPQ
jgi:hypothetical protein